MYSRLQNSSNKEAEQWKTTFRLTIYECDYFYRSADLSMGSGKTRNDGNENGNRNGNANLLVTLTRSDVVAQSTSALEVAVPFEFFNIYIPEESFQ